MKIEFIAAFLFARNLHVELKFFDFNVFQLSFLCLLYKSSFGSFSKFFSRKLWKNYVKPDNQLNIICLESKAFYALVNNVVERIKEEQGFQSQQIWISDSEAMELLRIKSKTTLQKLRDMGSIRYSQPMKKVILYDKQSILDYLDANANEIF